MWNFPGSGIEPLFLALAGGFLTTGASEKSQTALLTMMSNRERLHDSATVPQLVNSWITIWTQELWLQSTWDSPEAVTPLSSPVLPKGPSLKPIPKLPLSWSSGGQRYRSVSRNFLQTGASSAQVELQETVIYTVQSDTSSLHLPTIKQGLVVTNGPHAHGIAAPRDPVLLAAPRS